MSKQVLFYAGFKDSAQAEAKKKELRRHYGRSAKVRLAQKNFKIDGILLGTIVVIAYREVEDGQDSVLVSGGSNQPGSADVRGELQGVAGGSPADHA